MSIAAEVPIDIPESTLVQLVDAWLYELHLTRRDRLPDDPVDRPTLGVAVHGRVQQEGQPERHTVIIGADIQFPYNDNRAIAEMTCRVAGVFRIPDPARIDLDTFTVREAVILIYPYLRSMVGQVWRMSGLNAPPIPTLDTIAAINVLDETLASALRSDQRLNDTSREPARRGSKRRQKRPAKPASDR